MKDVALMTTQEAREIIEELQECKRAAIIIVKELDKQNQELRKENEALKKPK